MHLRNPEPQPAFEKLKAELQSWDLHCFSPYTSGKMKWGCRALLLIKLPEKLSSNSLFCFSAHEISCFLECSRKSCCWQIIWIHTQMKQINNKQGRQELTCGIKWYPNFRNRMEHCFESCYFSRHQVKTEPEGKGKMRRECKNEVRWESLYPQWVKVALPTV